MALNPSNEAEPGSAQAAPPAPPQDFSHEDYSRRMQAAIAAGGTATSSKPADGEPAPKKPAVDPQEEAKRLAMRQAFDQGPLGISLSKYKAMGRGVVNAVDDTIETVIDLFTGSKKQKTSEDLITGGEGQTAGERATQFIDNARDAIFGPKSGDTSDQMVEDIAQFTAGFYGAGKIKLFGRALNTLPTLVGGAVRGAIVDFAAFDPYKEQLAELVARSNIPGLKELGQAGSVTENDGPLIARIKRTAGGLVPGMAIDGLVAATRFFRGTEALKVAKTPAAKAAAEAEISKNGKILQNIADEKHVPAQPVVVTPAENGKFGLEIHPSWKEEFGDLSTHDQFLEAAAAKADATDISTELLARTKKVTDEQMALRQSRAKFNADFDARWEAEAQAASINEVLADRMTPKVNLTEDQTRSILDASTTALDMSSPEALVDSFGKMRANFPLMGAADQSEQLLRSVDSHLSGVFDRAQGREAVSFSESVDRAVQLAGMISREDAADYLRNTGAVLKNADANLLWMNSQLVEQGEKVAKWSAILDQQPWDEVATSEARRVLQDYVNLAADVTGSNSGVGRGLNALKARGDAKLVGMAAKGEAGAVEAAAAAGKDTPSLIAGMTPAQLRDVTRLFRQTKQPQVLFNTLASQVTHANMSLPAKIGRGLLEYFYNSVLSAPATHAGIFAGTATVSMIEDGVRVLAGVVTANPTMIREGADLLTGRLIYAKQSMAGMVNAFRSGASIIDPRPVYKAIPGVAGELVRTMGTRPIAAVDEFWRVNNNLAFVRMNSLRIARQDAAARGLTGKALDQFVSNRVTADVRASIDPATGASRLPAAREHASLPTFSAPLAPGSFGTSLEKMVQDHPWLTPVLPFVRTSVNVFDYSFVKGSPLGMLSSQMRQTIAKGGPEAAIAGTRMALGSTVWGAAGLMAFGGSITGNGPSDPKLRKMWLASHQPYSVKIGGEWHSYRRLEPFATALGTMSDLASIMRDNAHDDGVQEDGGKVFYGVLAASISAMSNKTYMSGLADFMEALNSDSPYKVKQFFDRLASTAVPNLVQVANADPYMRETTGMLDALKQRVPGWSTQLPAKYNVFGEPVTLLPSRATRTLNPFPARSAEKMTEDDLLLLDKAFMPPPTVVKYGKLSVNLHDRSYQSSKGGNLTPYERMMEITNEADLRGQIDQIISSDAYKRAGDGTDAFLGGRRFILLRDRIERVQSQAERKMLSEYPELKRELQGLDRARRASARSDDQGQGILDRINQ